MKRMAQTHPAQVGKPDKATRIDALVIGAGFAGLYMIHKLRGLGLSVRCIEAADDVGGTWYWNRYPGARCDVESLQYSFSFSEELEAEWTWTERYSGQDEIMRYLRFVADRLDLRRDITFSTRVTAAHFDAAATGWAVTTDGGEHISARFVITATGCLSASRVPDFPGLDGFQGEWHHTGRWPHHKVDFAGKRVAVIGTGSSGIQVIPMIARDAAHLSVFQRTPNFTIPAWNHPLKPERAAEWKEKHKALRAYAKTTRSGILYDYSTRSAFDVDASGQQREFEARWAAGGANFTHAFNDIFTNKAANDLAADFVRAKIRNIVKNPAVAALLTPTDHAIGTKRICVDTDYYATFNRPNVELVDVRANPIKAITPSGIRTSDRHHEFDIIVFATGYDAVTGALSRIDIRGRDGRALDDVWRDGPRSYLGLMVAGFPNLFTITGPGSPSILTNVVMSIEQHVEWISQCLADMAARGASVIEASEAAQDAWVQKVADMAAPTLFTKATSWYMGANVPGKPRVFLPFIGGLGVYTQICNDIIANGYEGFRLSGHEGGAA
jgi:cyclohexanone monooxygenase